MTWHKILLLATSGAKGLKIAFQLNPVLNTKIPCNVSLRLTVSLQIGRSTESPIDFVVTDTSGEGKEGEDPSVAPSTISRFACRVVCERNPPYTARIYAAGFDSSKNIFLGVSV